MIFSEGETITAAQKAIAAAAAQKLKAAAAKAGIPTAPLPPSAEAVAAMTAKTPIAPPPPPAPAIVKPTFPTMDKQRALYIAGGLAAVVGLALILRKPK